MYHIEDSLKHQEVSCPHERATVKRFLASNFWVYLTMSILYFSFFAYLCHLGCTSKYIYSVLIAICFLLAAVKSKGVEKQVLQPETQNSRLKKMVDDLMCLNWFVIVINLIGFFSVFILLLVWNREKEYPEDDPRHWPLIDGVAPILVLIPSIFQVAIHKDLNESLAKIKEIGDAPSDGQVNISGKRGKSQPGYGFAQSL